MSNYSLCSSSATAPVAHSLLSTLDSDEELEAVYDLFMESLFDGEDV